MKRLFLLARYKYHLFRLWGAEANHYGARRIVIEAQDELKRATELEKKTNADLDTAREAATRSGYRVARHDRLTALGIRA